MMSTKEGEILTPEAYAKQHKEAFRYAFNFLNLHFPPCNDEDWWLQLVRDASASSIEAGENTLVIELLIAVCNYLEIERKRRYGNVTED